MKRCTYVLRNGRTCSNPGTGRPPLCFRHQYADEPELDVIDRLFDQPAVQSLIDRIGGALDRFGTSMVDKLNNPRPAAPQQTRRVLDPRVILGFAPDTKLTVELIKERRRALANLWHPDKGGSPEAMQRLNAATDALLQQLKST